MDVEQNVHVTHKVFLVVMAVFTIVAMLPEVTALVENRKVELKDLLLMFIYAEVLGMLGAFYASHRTPIAIPLIIAMTVPSRLIILQRKAGNPSILVLESDAILLIAVYCWVVSRVGTSTEQNEK